MPLIIILSPGLTEAKTSSTEKKPYDSCELLPSKIESGSSEEFRLLGTYATGHMLAPWRCAVEIKRPDGSLRFGGYDYSTNYDGFPDKARQTGWSTPECRKIEAKVKAAFAEVKDTATMETLLRGSHPLLQPTQFSSAAPVGDTDF